MFERKHEEFLLGFYRVIKFCMNLDSAGFPISLYELNNLDERVKSCVELHSSVYYRLLESILKACFVIYTPILCMIHLR